jgi:hypothetical protein
MQIHKVKSNLRINANFAKLNKNCTIQEYRTEVAKGQFYRDEVKVNAVAVCSNEQYVEISNSLMNHREWMQEFGGTYCDYDFGREINAIWELTEAEMDIFKKECYNIGIVVLNAETREWFFVDSQGYGYARYVGMPVNDAKVIEMKPIVEEEENPSDISISVADNGDITLSNDYCSVVYRPTEKEFCGADHVDQYNMPRFYNQTSRSHKKAWMALKDGFDKDTTMYQAMGIIRSNGVRCRSYMSVD